jgi:hypothetical protein
MTQPNHVMPTPNLRAQFSRTFLEQSFHPRLRDEYTPGMGKIGPVQIQGEHREVQEWRHPTLHRALPNASYARKSHLADA